MLLAEPRRLFGRFADDSLTTGGARTQFQLLVTDLIKVQAPTASTVEGPGGRDWGIDTYVGKLSSGVAVWQSKFILDWDDKGPQSEVRDSFKHALAKAAEKHYTLRAWTLCVPCVLHPDQQKWFDGWATRTRTRTKVKISIWNGAELRHQLLRADAAHVRAEYFPHTLSPLAISTAEPEALAELDDPAQFDKSLFIRQLRAAGYEETDAARGLFFATDALFRDYSARGDARALRAMEELHQDIHSVWETNFNTHLATAAPDGRMPGLLPAVMSEAASRPDPDHLRLRPAHKQGAAHRVVEAEKAGWIRQWRNIIGQHRADNAAATRSETAEAAPVGDACSVDSLPSSEQVATGGASS